MPYANKAVPLGGVWPTEVNPSAMTAKLWVRLATIDPSDKVVYEEMERETVSVMAAEVSPSPRGPDSGVRILHHSFRAISALASICRTDQFSAQDSSGLFPPRTRPTA